jgi:hypothetical protein
MRGIKVLALIIGMELALCALVVLVVLGVSIAVELSFVKRDSDGIAECCTGAR